MGLDGTTVMPVYLNCVVTAAILEVYYVAAVERYKLILVNGSVWKYTLVEKRCLQV